MGNPIDGQRTTSETIYQTVIGLHNAGRQITRQVLAQVTGLQMSVVDDHMKRIVDDGRCRRVIAGVFEVVEVFPADRPISRTTLANGLTKLEIGDQLLELYPTEAQKLGQMLLGDAVQYATIQGERDIHDLIARMEVEVRETRRQLQESRKRQDEMAKTVSRLQRPQDLFASTP